MNGLGSMNSKKLYFELLLWYGEHDYKYFFILN